MMTAAISVLEPPSLKDIGNTHHLKSEFGIFPLELDGDFFYPWPFGYLQGLVIGKWLHMVLSCQDLRFMG